MALSSFSEREYRLRAVLGMVKFMIHGLKAPLPWSLSPITERLIRLPNVDLELVADSNGELIAALPKRYATEILTLTERETVTLDGAVSDGLFVAVVRTFCDHFPVNFLSVRHPRVSDPGFVLEGASVGERCVVEVVSFTGGYEGGALAFPSEEMALHFCHHAQQITLTMFPSGY